MFKQTHVVVFFMEIKMIYSRPSFIALDYVTYAQLASIVNNYSQGAWATSKESVHEQTGPLVKHLVQHHILATVPF
jgi:hypothetical protein